MQDRLTACLITCNAPGSLPGKRFYTTIIIDSMCRPAAAALQQCMLCCLCLQARRLPAKCGQCGVKVASKTRIQGVGYVGYLQALRGAYTHRSSPIVVKVCIEPNELILAGLQLLSCSCLRLSMSGFCSCILHGDFVHQLPKEAVLQNSAQAFQKATTDDFCSSSDQLTS